MIEKLEKLFGQDGDENPGHNAKEPERGPDQGIKEPMIDPDSGVVLTPSEVEEEKIRKGDDSNWYREQK